MPLSSRLRVRVHSECQQLLRAENRVCGRAPERVERQVGLEGLRESHDAREVDHLHVSMAVDSLAHDHLTPLVHHLCAHLLRVTLHLGLLHVASLFSQIVAFETASAGTFLSVSGLTAEKRVCGGALEVLEGRVRLESLREVLGALRTDVVAVQTASEGAFRVSAPDSREAGVWRRTRAPGGPSSS